MNPAFEISGIYEYTLNDNSPCIDPEIPYISGFGLSETDLAGNPIVVNE